MDTFTTLEPNSSQLFIEVGFDFDYLARTWVTWEEIGKVPPKKGTIADSQPGDGLIGFCGTGKSIDFIGKKRFVIGTYLDLQKIDDPDEYMETFSINYRLLEDDDVPGDFYQHKIYTSKKSEMVWATNHKSVYITKIIEVR